MRPDMKGIERAGGVQGQSATTSPADAVRQILEAACGLDSEVAKPGAKIEKVRALVLEHADLRWQDVNEHPAKPNDLLREGLAIAFNAITRAKDPTFESTRDAARWLVRADNRTTNFIDNSRTSFTTKQQPAAKPREVEVKVTVKQ